MKIKTIKLEDFHQFKNLEIDLTYPKGHLKEGEPLDKVCIIGQSGTGKTTLLKVIGGHTYTIQSLFNEYKADEFKKVTVTRIEKDIEVEVRVGINPANNNNTYYWNNVKENGKKIDFNVALKKFEGYQEKIKNQFIYFPAELKYNDVDKNDVNLLSSKVIDFGQYNLGDVWNIVLSKIQEYQESELKIRQEVSRIVEDNSTDMVAIQKAVKKLEKWRKREFNPLADVAEECLDPLLKHFNLKVKRDLDIQKKDDLGFIKIEDFKGNPIPQSLLSTGTKQVIFSAMPLYLLKPEDAIILYDEPERSLYPNIQQFIIDFYTGLTKNSQLIFATHSPIIASSFEPWEIVELKFDSKGEVYQELYYPKDKERHVDNYSIIPSYLTYDLVLNKIFDLAETYSSERSEKITQTLMLRNQLMKLKEEGKVNSVEGKKIYEEYRDLANKLFWNFDIG